MNRRIHDLDWQIWTDTEFEKRVTKLLCIDIDDATDLDFIELFDILQIIKAKKHSIKDECRVKAELNKKLSCKYHNITVEEIRREFKYFFTYDNNDELKADRYQFRFSFFKVFEEYNWHKIFKEYDLKNILENKLISLSDLLKTKYWGKKYPLVKELFLNEPENFQLLLSNFTDSKNNYVIPENISKIEFYKLAVCYVNGNSDFEPNLNYLKLMQNGLSGIEKFIDIDAILKLKIKKEIERQTNNFFYKNKGYKQRLAVYGNIGDFNKENSNHEIRGYVDVDFLKQYSDIPTLLNSIQYLYNFFNENGIWNLVSFPNIEELEISSILTLKSNRHYDTGSYFLAKQWIILNELRMVREVLKQEHHLEFEDMFNYFFSKYSERTFNLTWLPINFSRDESYGTKVSVMFISEENIRKQWHSYSQYHEINRDLINLTNTPKIEELKSIVPNKYVYVDSREMIRINNLLFSTQKNLGYIDENLYENTFIELIYKHKVSYSDFATYQLSDINFLIKEEIISVRKNGEIFVTHNQKQMILICKFLWAYGVINYYNFPFVKAGDLSEEYHNLINTKIRQGYLKTESTLFSIPEVNYLNYLLNNSEYNNAKALRNKHDHSYIAEKDEENLEDYLYSLAVIFVYIIKINEEFHLKNLLEGKEGFWTQ